MQPRKNMFLTAMLGLTILLISGCGDTNLPKTTYTETVIRGPVAESWTEYYDGPASRTDTAWAVAADDLGNVYVAGLSRTNASNVDYCIIKYDSDGNLLWATYYDGPAHGEDRAWAMTLDKLGNVYVTGESQGNGTAYDYTTVKYDSDGTEIWSARYNGPSSGSDVAKVLTVDEKGDVYVTGKSQGNGTDYDYVTVKYDSDGTEVWSVRYNGPSSDSDAARALTVDRDGNVYITGESQSNDTGYDYATVKYDSNGKEMWVARYNGPGATNDLASAMAVDSSGNIYVTGVSGAVATGDNQEINYDYATVKYSSEGQEIWVARYDGPASGTDKAAAIETDSDGNVYVSGSSGDSRANTANYDYATVKYNTNGKEVWTARYNGTESTSDSVTDMTIDPSGNIYVTGTSLCLDKNNSRHSCDTIKYSSDGQELWIAQHDSSQEQADYVTGIAIDRSNSIYVSGWFLQDDTDADFFIVKYTQLAQ